MVAVGSAPVDVPMTGVVEVEGRSVVESMGEEETIGGEDDSVGGEDSLWIWDMIGETSKEAVSSFLWSTSGSN